MIGRTLTPENYVGSAAVHGKVEKRERKEKSWLALDNDLPARHRPSGGRHPNDTSLARPARDS